MWIKKALWKYDSSSSKPTLHPLENLRTDISDSGVDDSWKQIMQELVNDLPDDVKAAYEQNLLLPPEERNPTLVALGKLLEGTAVALNWLQNSVNVLDPQNRVAGPGSEIEARQILNMALADTVMTGIIVDSNVTFQSVQNALLQIGNNDPHFDDLVGILNQIGSAYTTLLSLNSSSTNMTEG